MAVRDIFGAVLLLAAVCGVSGQSSGAAGNVTNTTTTTTTTTSTTTTTTTTTTSTAGVANTTTTSTKSVANTTANVTTTSTTTTTTTATSKTGNATTTTTTSGGNMTTTSTTTIKGGGENATTTTPTGKKTTTTTTVPKTTMDPNATTIAVAATATVKRSYVMIGKVNTGGYTVDDWFIMVAAVTVEPGMTFIAICVSEFKATLVAKGATPGAAEVTCEIVKASRQRRGRRLGEVADVKYNLDATMAQAEMSNVSTDDTALGETFGANFQSKVREESASTGSLGGNAEWAEKYGDGSNFTSVVDTTESSDVVVTTAAPAPAVTTSGANMIFVTMGTAMTLFMGMLI